MAYRRRQPIQYDTYDLFAFGEAQKAASSCSSSFLFLKKNLQSEASEYGRRLCQVAEELIRITRSSKIQLTQNLADKAKAAGITTRVYR